MNDAIKAEVDAVKLTSTKLCPRCGLSFRRVSLGKTKVHSYCVTCHDEIAKVWRKDNPRTSEQRKKHNVRSYAQASQKRGKLVPRSCEECGERKAQKHHPDYTKPLYVKWLCKRCHQALHRKITAQTVEQ